MSMQRGLPHRQAYTFARVTEQARNTEEGLTVAGIKHACRQEELQSPQSSQKLFSQPDHCRESR